MTDSPESVAPAATIRILIADDHEVVRIGLAAMLAAQEGFEVVAQAGTGDEATRLTLMHRPDVVVMDIRMPGGSGIDACRAITAARPGTPVIMLTSHADSEALFDAIEAGASGYVLERIRNAGRLEEAGAFVDLTEQERRVLAHIADGASNRQIADRMGLAEKTVRNYVSSILAKLALESRSQAAAYAIRNRLPELAEQGPVDERSEIR